MTTRIRRSRSRPRRVPSVPAIAWLVATVGAASIAAQPESTPTDAQLELRQAVQDRFEVVVLSEGLGLSPREGAVDARMIEVGDGSIAVDGRPVSGQELRDVIGDDADVVFRLTYLDATTRAALFQTTDAPPAAVAPQPPDAPAVVSEPQPASEDADETEEREPERPARRTTMSDIVRVFGSVTVDADERVRGDVVVIAGSLSIDGEVTGDVVVVGGSASDRTPCCVATSRSSEARSVDHQRPSFDAVSIMSASVSSTSFEIARAGSPALHLAGGSAHVSFASGTWQGP